ncbi:MAG: chromosome segregation protein SMC [Gammaproteobacteria bacterium]|nr:MAG: chromosome segregation protein SMC [Gammaproteobacteria bacterium]
MRLKKIKLTGFKSFVDPTTIQIPSNLVAVVGPNGCGKSNIIDAVRWVMGESSAKHLRGESMADVIFDGSTTRKPVGVAVIELTFDNSDGSLGGQYAQYAEIAIKRQVNRDGISTYSLNGTRCRRRDITDVFLGTGLGPRSYSIIEQGMISRLIEAKPEELRVYLEEAAGISKYKERRRETENRIRHTEENLARLSDLREEIERQLQHAKRQARTAERYQELKQEERKVHAELLALNARAMKQQLQKLEQQAGTESNTLEKSSAEVRRIEADLEQQRAAHVHAGDQLNEIQGRYYAVGAEVSRVEQSIQHARELERRQVREAEEVASSRSELQRHLDNDRKRVVELEQALAGTDPDLVAARGREQGTRETRLAAEQAMQAWQSEWETFNAAAAEPAQQAQVERTRTDQLEERRLRLHQRRQRLDEALVRIDLQPLTTEIATLGEQRVASQGELERREGEHTALHERIEGLRSDSLAMRTELDQLRDTLQRARGRQASLEALQQAALGKTDSGAVDWLKHAGLANAPRLAQNLRPEAGWERALETVLGPSLEAVCVDDLAAYAERAAGLETGHLFLVDPAAVSTAPAPAGEPLSAKLAGNHGAATLLAGIYAADDLDHALRLRGGLAAHESIVTRDGLWLGSNWLRVAHGGEEHAGVLAREQELRELEARIVELGDRLGSAESRDGSLRAALREEEEQREQLRRSLQEAHRALAEINASLGDREARHEQLQARAEAIRSEIAELDGEDRQYAETLESSRGTLHRALEEMEKLAARRETLESQRDGHRAALEEARRVAQTDRDAVHTLALRVESLRTEYQATVQGLQRIEEQLARLGNRHSELEEARVATAAPQNERQQELERLLAQRVEVESRLGSVRGDLEGIESGIRQAEEGRMRAEQAVDTHRETLEATRMRCNELRVRGDTLQEQIIESGFEREPLLDGLLEDAEPGAWQERLDRLTASIQRLGAINLAAIDEFRELSERTHHLDSQFTDITDALATLQEAIRKIDRETRQRFRDTFEKVNAQLGVLFPRLFGGGHAYLQLTGNDLLDTGVTVMARPPGKRNSTIHLLSGGEKALTAVAMVFSIFQLSPAPFCMLDEVDAPLDDANVGRFCEMVGEMAQKVQFVIITHNKVTMELADQLLGVTMNEPGVSRLVSVDVGEAVRMAAG